MKKKMFSDEELKTIGFAAETVWSDIGCDCLQSSGKNQMSRSQVIELVMDASRLEQEIARGKHGNHDLSKRVSSVAGSMEVEKFLKKNVFTCRTYSY